jgi:PQQ-like domain
MNNIKRTTTIASVLIFTMALTLIAIPIAYAHDPPWNFPTYAFINVAPNPVGVGQSVTVAFWIDKYPPTAYYYYGDRWHGMTVTVTKPDGTSQTLGPFTSDSSGGTFTTYTPDKTGNYTFQFSFPGQTIAGDNPPPTGTIDPSRIGDYYQPSTSDKVTLIVQDAAVAAYPTTPLPTNYWTRPVFAMNTNWYTISGNWLGLGAESFASTGQYNSTSNFNPYTKGPNTAHILWTKPYAAGGLMGGEFGDNQMNSNFKSTSQYEPKFAPIIIDGILYNQEFAASYSNPGPWIATNLKTGQTLWTLDNNEILILGQVLAYVTPNQYGGTPYLWGEGFAGTYGTEGGPMMNGTWSMYEATTGKWILNIEQGPSYGWGFGVGEADDGTLMVYYVNYTDFTLNCWNSTKAIQDYSLTTGQNVNMWLWRPAQGASIDWGLGIQWTIPVPMEMNGAPMDAYFFGVNKLASGVTLLNTYPQTSQIGYDMFNPGFMYYAGIDAKTGNLLWGPKNITKVPWTRVSGLLYDIGPAGNGIWCEYTSETFSWDAYSLTTGQHLWGPVSGGHNPYSYQNVHADMAYGTLYASDLGGYVNAFDLSNGKLLWTWFSGNSGSETPYGIWPVLHIDAIADGKLYVMGGHTYSPPLFHGAQLYCINATSGKEIWSINDFTTTNGPAAAIADGVLVEPNAYDNQIYAYGVGPSRITVNAPSVGVTTATPITISGTVTDISAGSQQNAVAANFPNGLPCVSDESMTQFMEVVYQQQAMPANITGVPVTLYVMDSNNNYRSIGTTTSNAMGVYGLTWTPDIPGNFVVTATFAGSQSYYESSASAYFYASEAVQAATPEPTQQPQSMADLYFLPVSIVLIIAIVAVLVMMLLMFRKR